MNLLEINLTSFGKFENKKIELGNNFNIIYGENELGKTTISKFIEGMFFGFVKPYLKSLRFTDDFEKYKPWSSEKYEGSIIFQYDSKKIRLYRDFANKEYKLFDEDTGREISKDLDGYEANNLSFPGEYFFNCSSEVFLNTLLIGQGKSLIAKDSKKYISDKIIDIFSESSKMFSVVEALNSLNELKNNIGTEKSFKKPYGILKERERKLNEELKLLKVKKDSYDEYLFTIDKKKKEYLEVRDNIDCIDVFYRYEEQQKNLGIISRTNDLKQDILNIKKDIEKIGNSNKIIEEELARVEGIKEELSYMEREFNELSRDKKYIYTKLNELEKKISFEDNKKELKKKLEKNEEYQKNSLILIMVSIVLLFISGIFFLTPVDLSISIILVFISIILLIVTVSIKYYLKNKKNSIIIEIRENYNIIIKNKNSTQNSFFTTNLEIYDEFSKLEAELNEKDKDIEILLNEEDFNNDTLKDISFNIQDKTGIKLENHLKNKDRLNDLRNELQVKENELRTIDMNFKIEYYPEEELIEFNDDFEMVKMLNLEELKAKSDILIKEISSLEERKKIVEDDVLNIPSIIEEISMVDKDIEKTEDYLESLNIAMEEINNAHNEIKINYLPRMSDNINQMFYQITGYGLEVKIDEYFNMKFLANDSGNIKDVESLSQGTTELLYIALRIATTNEVFGEDELVIFDDAFNNFDDNRLKRILFYLITLSKNRQVILFTCQNREKEAVEGIEFVKVVNL